jgi:hypothetical protein
MEMADLQQRVVGAYGGESPWRESTAVEITYSAWGWAFRLKWQRPFRKAHARLDISQPRAIIAPIDRRGNTGVLDGHDVRIEDANGNGLASREGARSLFPGGRRLLWWDHLDQTYFAGYAIWNYMVLPALLLREDIEWTQVRESSLEGRFPSTLPTHCERQQFHFDPETHLLRQHDYTANVIGGWAKAAHVVLEHQTEGGVPFTSKRRVTPRGADERPRSGPLLVGIDIHEWRLA